MWSMWKRRAWFSRRNLTAFMEILECREYEDRIFAQIKVADSSEPVTFSRWPGIKTVCNYPGWDDMSEWQKHQLVDEILDAISHYKQTEKDGGMGG